MSETGKSAIALLREQFNDAACYVDTIVADLLPEDAHWKPAGTALPAGAVFGHLAVAIDGVVNGWIAGRTPLFMSSWAGKTGLSEPPPGPDPATGSFPDWTAWSRRVTVELAALRRYSGAVNASVDGFLATLSDADIARTLDLSSIGLGQVTSRFLLTNAVIGHAFSHGGEIACLKGLRGKRGGP